MNGSVVSSSRREGVVVNRQQTSSEAASGMNDGGYKVTEEFRFVKGKPKEDSSVSGMILFTIQMALTIVQTKVIPMAMFVMSFPPVKMARGLFLDGLLSMMFYLPLSITRAVLVQLGLVKYIASWLEIDNRVTIVASNEEVQKEMEKMRIYIRDVNDVNTRLTTQKDFQNADFNRRIQTLEKEHKAAKDNLHDLDQTCRSIHSELASSKNENSLLKTRLKDAEAIVNKTNNSLLITEEELRMNQRVSQENEMLQKKVKDATDGWNKTSSEVQMLRNELTNREETIKATSNDINVMRNDLQGLRENVQREAMRMLEALEQRNTIEKIVKEKELIINEMRMTMEQMQQQKAQWESEMTQLKDHAGNKENEVQRVVEDMRVVQSQREEVQHNVQAIYQERDNLRRELEDTRMALDRTRQELELTRGNMEREIGELRQQLDQKSSMEVVVQHEEVVRNGTETPDSLGSDQIPNSQQANPSKKKKQGKH